jgi:hypothetical protein
LATKNFFNIFAVEPNEKMREIFKQNFKNIPIYDGLSTKIPFEDNFFQIVFIAQAFHWFSNIESLTEILRVLKPQSHCENGKSGLVMLFNIEDCKHETYMQDLFDLWSKYDKVIPSVYYKLDWKKIFETNEAKTLFSEINLKYHENKELYLPIQHVWNRILSKSFIATLDETVRISVKKEVESMVEKNKNLHVYREDLKQVCLQYPYVTLSAWCFGNK